MKYFDRRFPNCLLRADSGKDSRTEFQVLKEASFSTGRAPLHEALSKGHLSAVLLSADNCENHPQSMLQTLDSYND